MTFFELLHKFPKEELSLRFSELFDISVDQASNALTIVLNDLLKLKPRKTLYLLLVYWEYYMGSSEPFVSVSGFNPENPTKPDSGDRETYAIEFLPWSEWLAMPIHPDCFPTFSEIDVVCHSIGEMTFGGLTRKEAVIASREFGRIIRERLKEIDKIARD